MGGSLFKGRGSMLRWGVFPMQFQDFDRAVALDPQNGAARLGRFYVLGRLGRLSEASDDYIRARELVGLARVNAERRSGSAELVICDQPGSTLEGSDR